MEETEERHAKCFFNYLSEGIAPSVYKYCVDLLVIYGGLQQDQPDNAGSYNIKSKFGAHIRKRRQMDSAISDIQPIIIPLDYSRRKRRNGNVY